MNTTRWLQRFSKGGLFAGLLLGAWVGSPIFADAVVTLAGKTIEGTIVRETDDVVVLNTTDYGELTFRKVALSSIRRTSGSPAPSGAANTGNPFGGGGNASPNPFNNNTGGGNPFNSGGGNPPTAGGGNPFSAGGGNPFSNNSASSAQNRGGGNPFAPSQPALTNQVNSSTVSPPAEAPQKVYNPASLPAPRAVSLPEVPIAWQGVFFGITDGEEIRITPKSNIRSGAENEQDLYFTGPLRVRADNSKFYAVLKNGRDYIRFNPRSQVEITESTFETTQIDLFSGAIWLNLQSSNEPRSVVINTQVAEIVGSKESVFRVGDALEQGVHVAVIRGEVTVASKSAQVKRTLTAGQMFLVRPEGSVSPVRPVDQLVQYEEKGWENLELSWFQNESRTQMGVGMLDPRDLVNRNELTGLIREVSSSFLNYTQDTGLIPSEADGYTVLLENTHGASGWNGPYLEGIVPPVDSWGRPLRYTTKNTDSGGKEIGVVYSLGEDGRDNSGNPSADITEMVLYYQVMDPS
ncbi:MAG: type II secretion system protein GspG [Sumerlaeia bacterium]